MMEKYQPRQIGTINYIGLKTLIKRELGRFVNVYLQTLIAPIVTTILFFAVLSLAFGGVAKEIDGVSYLSFLAPGLVMMAMVQNSFANTSSSLIISKVQGNIVDVLMPPLSAFELLTGYLVGGVLRGVLIGVMGIAVLSPFVNFTWEFLFISFIFAFLGCFMLAIIGMITGIWAEKFDHIAAVTNFIIMPMTFLSGTFYSLNSLPENWHVIAEFNPFFYMIDGFRYGFISVSDGNIVTGLFYLLIIDICLTLIALFMLHKGYKIKS